MTESINQTQFSQSLPYVPFAGGFPAQGAGAGQAPWDSVQPAGAGFNPGAGSSIESQGSGGGLLSGVGSWLSGMAGGIGSVIDNFGSVINGFISQINSAMNSLGSSSTSTASPAPAAAAPEQLVTQGTFSDWGDPHMNVSATTDAGQTISDAWSDMDAHDDLLTSDSFNGGYQIATSVTTPNAQGVTLNSSAGVYTQDGAVSVGLSSSGGSITDNGQTVAMQAGQSYSLGNDEVATENADGSVSVSQANANGGSITTVLSMNAAGGVDVNAQASGVDVGGYLLNQIDQPGTIG